MKLSVSVSVDRTAALLKGNILGEKITIEVEPGDFSPDTWKLLVQELGYDHQSLNSSIGVSGVEVSDLDEALNAYQAKREEKAREQREAFAALIEKSNQALEENKRRVTLDLVPAQIMARSEDGAARFVGQMYPGFEAPKLENLPSSWGVEMTQERAKEYSALQRENAKIEEALEVRVKQANAEAFEKARPALETELAKREKQAAEEEAVKRAAFAGVLKRRLASGLWEMETPSYNQRRYTSPWCARVTFPNGSKAVYEWGQSSAKWGEAGVLSVACKPGEVIAWGQKDLRRPDRSTHCILVMCENGSMDEIDKAGAYKLSHKVG